MDGFGVSLDPGKEVILDVHQPTCVGPAIHSITCPVTVDDDALVKTFL